MSARKKVFARSAEQIHPLAEGHGASFATDEIMVKGRRVGYAYREPQDRAEDSGWRFSAGDESDAYMDDAENHGLYDVNTVANYDPEIIPLLESGVGAAFVRDPETGKFVSVAKGERASPTVEGHYALTASWGIELPPGTFKRRIEQASLVLWRPGLTAWINVWNSDRDEPADMRAEGLRGGRSPQAFDILAEQSGSLHRFAYRLTEPSDDHRVAGFYGFAVGRSGHVQVAIYFDDERDSDLARAMWRGLKER